MNERAKITTGHLIRQAIVYLRQSSAAQVEHNRESTERQYALANKARELGWPEERILVIDEDLGLSGSGAVARSGFARLTAEVALAHVGLVLGLEVSRLARNNADWHRLIDLAGLTDTLIGDADGIYHPALFNDRLLLGLKGTMSEAELHVLKARLQGGICNKARRGELELALPIGLAYGADGAVVLDPDRQIQDTVRLLFETFRQCSSASAVVRRFQQEGWRFPRRVRRGVGKGDVLWGALDHSRVADPAQPALCRCLRLWSHAQRMQCAAQVNPPQGAARAVAGPHCRRSRRLHRLAGVRAQPGDAQAKHRRLR